jgi:formyltetrahydrofolate deformylase
MQTFAANVAERYEMQWRLAFVNELKKVGILVSKVDHALLSCYGVMPWWFAM